MKKIYYYLKEKYIGPSVDTNHNVISYIQADFADKNDTRHLIDITEKSKKRLEDHDLHIASIFADTNFSNGKNFHYLEKQNIVGYSMFIRCFLIRPFAFAHILLSSVRISFLTASST